MKFVDPFFVTPNLTNMIGLPFKCDGLTVDGMEF